MTLAVEWQPDQSKVHKTLGVLIQACLGEKVTPLEEMDFGLSAIIVQII